MIDRRSFLAVPLVFGLDRLPLQAQDPAMPGWYDKALALMKANRRLGLVIVVDPSDRKIGENLAKVLELRTARDIHGQAVVITMIAPLARRLVLQGEETFNRILLDPDGRRLAADRVGPDAFATADDFLLSFRPFVEGVDGARLRERAVETPELRALLADLDAEDPEARQRAAAHVGERAGRHYPWLLWTSRQPGSPERRARINDGLRQWAEAQRTLPFGATVDRSNADPCPPCGRVVMAPNARTFLRFLEN